MAATGNRRLAMLVALSAGAFLATGSSIGITPFLLEIGRDLQTDLAAAGNLVALQSVSWGVTSLLAGAASDRLGRRPLLGVGLLILVVSGVGVALSDSYNVVAWWRLFGGIGGGAYMGAVFATVSDHFPAAARGRSLGWVVTGQSLALVLGVPAMTLAGTVTGWRGAVLAHAMVVLVSSAAVWALVPPASRHSAGQALPFRSVARLVGPRVLALLFAASTERVCYAAVAVFLPTFLLTRYAVDAPQLAFGLGLVAIGNLVGNLVGGQLSDRVSAPQILLAGSLVGAGVLALPVLAWAPTFTLSVACACLYTLVNATGRPAVLTLLSEVSAEARGAVLGVNITFSSLGWVLATAIGGSVVGVAGFGGLAFLTLGFGLVGGALSLATWLRPHKPGSLRLARSER